MVLTLRDIEIMGWVLEQKYMTVDQVKRVFWSGVAKSNIEAYRRLKKNGNGNQYQTM